jgi:single-strand DNA-binding protein
MASFNQVLLMGNVTRDPQVRQLPSATKVAEFGLATNRRYRSADGEDRDEVTYVDCAAFGKQAEVIERYVTKGKPLFVQGRLKYDTWEDKTGQKRNKLSVIVENFQFIGAKDGGGGFTGAAAEGEKKENGQKELWRDRQQDAAPEKPGRRSGRERQFKEADIPF